VTRPLSTLNPNSCLGLVAARARNHKAGSMSKIAEHSHFVGVDVSKDWLDVCVLPGRCAFRVTNTTRGVWSLVARLAECEDALVVMEATGGFEARVLEIISAAGIAVAMVNPRQVRAFARALGILAKTDRTDALAIARYAEAVKPASRRAQRSRRDPSLDDTSASALRHAHSGEGAPLTSPLVRVHPSLDTRAEEGDRVHRCRDRQACHRHRDMARERGTATFRTRRGQNRVAHPYCLRS
jgi:transposase